MRLRASLLMCICRARVRVYALVCCTHVCVCMHIYVERVCVCVCIYVLRVCLHIYVVCTWLRAIVFDMSRGVPISSRLGVDKAERHRNCSNKRTKQK